jgi:hypothetical protein
MFDFGCVGLAVDLDDESAFLACEVDDVGADRFLTS